METDTELLRQFREEGSEPAFRALVERHLGMVRASAQRILAGDAHAAQDVVQAVFTDLARKAASLPRDVLLGGWLYQHAYFLSRNHIRTEQRRRARERTAMEMLSHNDPPAGDAHWAQLAPMLDEALQNLDQPDREAIVLRFLQQYDVRSVGQVLGLSENTAQKRIERALDKLRAVLTSRGVTVSTALLYTTLEAGAATSPESAGISASISASALDRSMAAANFTPFIHFLSVMKFLKISIAIALVLIAGGLIVLINGKVHSPAPTTTAGGSATLAAKPVHASTIDAPKLAAVKPSATASDAPVPLPPIPGAPAGAREEIAARIDDIVSRLEAGDAEGVLLDYFPDVDFAAMSPGQTGPIPSRDPYPTRAEWVQLMDKYRTQYIAVLQSMKTATPAYDLSENPDFRCNDYTYEIIDPVSGQRDNHFEIFKEPYGRWSFGFFALVRWDFAAKHANKP